LQLFKVSLNDKQIENNEICIVVNEVSCFRLSLEWNSIGIFVDAFSQFCKGVEVNETLEFLDLKNNQLPPECGQYLGDALKHNTSLKSLG